MRSRLPFSALLAVLLLPGIGRGQSSDLNTYGVLAQGDVRIKADAFVGQDVGSDSARVRLSTGASVGGTVAANLIEMRTRTIIYADVYYNVFSAKGRPPIVVVGALHPSVSLPFITLPPPPTVHPGLQRLDYDKNVAISFPGPGQYAAITAGASTVVEFRGGGVYEIGELSMHGRSATLRCRQGDICTVRVLTKLSLPNNRVNTTGGVPDVVGTLNLEFAGASTVKLGRPGAVVKASVTAVNALVNVGSSRRAPTSVIGRIVAREVRIGTAAVLNITQPPPPVCGNGIVEPPTEQCDPPRDNVCPGTCLPDCTCTPSSGTPILHSIGPSVLHNASSFGIQAFGANFLPGAQLELSDLNTNAVLATLPTTFVSANELTAKVPAGLPVLSGMQRELTARIINPNSLRSI